MIADIILQIHVGFHGEGWSAYCAFRFEDRLRMAIESRLVNDDIKNSILQPCWVRLQEMYKKWRAFFAIAKGLQSSPAARNVCSYEILCELFEGHYNRKVHINWGKGDWAGSYKGAIRRIWYEPACDDGVRFYQSIDETEVFSGSLSAFGKFWSFKVIGDEEGTPEEV